MAYKGPDISAWQGDIDINSLSPQVDFFIFRAFASKKDKKVDRNVNLAIANNKPYGLYIYSYAMNVSQAEEEAQKMIEIANSYSVKPKFLVIDMEDADDYKKNHGMPSDQTLKDICTVQCEAFEKAGYYAMIYASTSWFNTKLAGLTRFDKWVAHWPTSGGKQTGNSTSPDGENASRCGIWQFTSKGRLNGYNGDLDMNYCYKDILVGKSNEPTPQSATTPEPKPNTPTEPTLELVARVFEGKYGNGEDRKNNLGTRYSEVQNIVDHIATADVNTLVKETKDGKYGNGDLRKRVLGSRYSEVQKVINGQSNTSSYKSYTVKAGDTLSGIAAKYGTTYQKIAKDNGIANPNKISIGQVLKIY